MYLKNNLLYCETKGLIEYHPLRCETKLLQTTMLILDFIAYELFEATL